MKIFSHQFRNEKLNWKGYEIHAYHPIHVRIVHIGNYYFLSKKLENGEWGINYKRAFQYKKDALRVATNLLETLIQQNTAPEIPSHRDIPNVAYRLSRKQAFEILGIPEGSPKDVWEGAYKRLAIANHPDRGGSLFLMQQINAAREALRS